MIRLLPDSISGARSWSCLAGLLVFLLLGSGAGSGVRAQEPGEAVPDPSAPDALPLPVQEGDPTLLEPPIAVIIVDDTVSADTLSADTLSADTLVADSAEVREVRHLPSFSSPVHAGWETGIWEWDAEELLATRALTLVDLLAEAPGMVPLQGGDFGQPAAISAFGLEGGRVRVYLDGVEMPPLDGGVVDLSRVGLGGLGQVRVERRLGELRIDLTPLRLEDPRAFSLLEVGTGDLNTNFFRGTIGLPFALGGGVVAFIDRIDTEGTNRSEPGVSFGAGVRHTVFIGENGGIVWDLRRMSSKRPSTLWTPATVQRSDFGIQGRYRFVPGVLGTAFYRSSSLRPVADSLTALEVGEDPRRIMGLRLSIERGGVWGEAEHRSQSGDRWPETVQSLRGGGALGAIGGFSVGLDREGWESGETALNTHVRGWTSPRYGFSLFAEFEQGERGVPGSVPPPPTEPEEGEEEEEEIPLDAWLPSFTERTGLRAGVGFQRGDWALGAAILRVEADSLHPMSFHPDRGDLPTIGGERNGVEVSLRLPVSRIMQGLALEGSGQLWDEDSAWRYLPSRIYQARLRYHRVFLATENLEVWWDLGLRGRNAMVVPSGTVGADPATEVPFRQSWFARVQVRVIAVRLFLDWENVTGRDLNQDFPDRILPKMRIAYGIRWTLWN